MQRVTGRALFGASPVRHSKPRAGKSSVRCNQIRVVGGIDFNNLTGFVNEPRTWGVQFKALF